MLALAAGLAVQAAYSASGLLLRIEPTRAALVVPFCAMCLIGYGLMQLVMRFSPIRRLHGVPEAVVALVVGGLGGIAGIGSFMAMNRLFLWP